MRKNILLLCLTLLLPPAAASAQVYEVYGSGGATITDPGNSLSVGFGFTPSAAPKHTILFSFDRTQVRSQITQDGPVISASRGGTLYLGLAEYRFAPFGRGKIGPFVLAGFGGGVSKPTVNDMFPNRVTNRAAVFFAGGGVEVPLSRGVSVFGEARAMLGMEGIEGMIGVAPLRAGVNVRF